MGGVRAAGPAGVDGRSTPVPEAPASVPARMAAGRRPGWVDFGLIPLANVATAFLVSGLVVLMVGENPLEAVGILLWGALGFGEGIGFTLFYATNFILTGLAVAEPRLNNARTSPPSGSSRPLNTKIGRAHV